MVRRSLQRKRSTRARLWASAVCVMLFGLAGFVIAAGLNEAAQAKFSELERQYALPSGIMGKVAKIESGGNATAGNPARAYGLFQWLPNSWLYATKALYGHPKEPSLRADPFVAAEVTAFSFAQTKAKLGALIQQAGVDQTVGIYLGHFLGPGGAPRFLRNYITNPGGAAANDFSKEAANNKPVFYNGGSPRTYSQVINYLASKLQTSGVTEITGYQGAYADASQRGRIMDAQGSAGLAQNYGGSLPTTTEFTYQPEYDAPLQGNTCTPQRSCTSNAVMMRDNACRYQIIEECQYGCQNGQCIQTPPLLQQQQQQPICPQGMLPSNGQCMPAQQQMLPQSQQPFSPQTMPQQTGTSPTSQTTGTPSTGASTGLGLTSSITGASSSIGSYLAPADGGIGNTGLGEKPISLIDSLTTDKVSLSPFGGSSAGFGTAAPVGSAVDITGVLGSGRGAFVSTGPGLGTQETFTSPDLKDTQGSPAAPALSGDGTTQSTGFIATVLSNLKTALLRAFDFLSSLRGNPAP